MSARILTGVLALLLISACNAEPDAAGKTVASDEMLTQRVEEAFNGIRVTGVEMATIPGLKALTINGAETVYVTEDGRYLFTGDVYELRDSGPVDLSDLRYESVRKAGLGKVDPDTMITFAAENPQTALYVFTDVTCGYCRKLHQEMSQYNALGITIHYLAFPRAGLQGAAADTMRAVWCAGDRAEALTQAKLGGFSAKPPSDCNSPVDQQYQLGRSFGVRGTPAVFTPDGQQLGGYVPPDELAERLQLK